MKKEEYASIKRISNATGLKFFPNILSKDVENSK